MYSIVILTKNEEQTIQNCLNSLPKDYDILVLDSGSSDSTRQIVTNYNIPLYIHIQEGPFLISEQRNWALKNCYIKNEWVLFLDADETLNIKLHEKILDAIKNPLYNAYKLTPRYLFWGKWLKRTMGYPNWHDRLLKKDEVWIEGGVWEHFCNSAKVGFINVPYDHYANSKGFIDWLERINRYSSWDANISYEYLYYNKNIQTKRKVRLREFAIKFWYLRPFIRFIFMYIIRFGFLEGWKSFVFCMHIFIYEFIILIKLIEKRRIEKNLPL